MSLYLCHQKEKDVLVIGVIETLCAIFHDNSQSPEYFWLESTALSGHLATQSSLSLSPSAMCEGGGRERERISVLAFTFHLVWDLTQGLLCSAVWSGSWPECHRILILLPSSDLRVLKLQMHAVTPTIQSVGLQTQVLTPKQMRFTHWVLAPSWNWFGRVKKFKLFYFHFLRKLRELELRWMSGIQGSSWTLEMGDEGLPPFVQSGIIP